MRRVRKGRRELNGDFRAGMPHGLIASTRDGEHDFVGGALPLIIALQLFSELRYLDADDGVVAGIVAWGAVVDADADLLLANRRFGRFRRARQQVDQEFLQPSGAAESLANQNFSRSILFGLAMPRRSQCGLAALFSHRTPISNPILPKAPIAGKLFRLQGN